MSKGMYMYMFVDILEVRI